MSQRFVELYRKTRAAIRNGLRDLGGALGVLFSAFDPRGFRSVVVRDTAAIKSSSQYVVASTSSLFGSVVSMIVFAPIQFLRWLWYAPLRAWYFIRSRTPLQLAALASIVVVGTVGAALPLYRVVKDRRVDNLRREQFRQLEKNFANGNFDGAKHNLEVLKRITPGDEPIADRLRSLEEGEAQPTDRQVARLLMRHFLSKGKIKESCREAKKYLVIAPNDWEACLIVADEALRRGDRPAAMDAIAKLPAPNEPAQGPALWSCLYATRILRETGASNRMHELIDYVAEMYVPTIRAYDKESLEPVALMQLVDAYDLAMYHLAERPSLASFWVPIQELCHSVAESPSSSAMTLAMLGHSQERHLDAHLKHMLQKKLIEPTEYDQYVAEIEKRLTRIWTRIIELDPKLPYGYLGLAMQKARAGKLNDAVAEVDKGIQVCGATPEMIEKKAELLRRIDPVSGLTYLDQAMLDESKVSLQLCKTVAEAAIAAGRPDKALDAIERAKKIQTGIPVLVRLEAEALNMAGRPTEAAAVLKPILPTSGGDPLLTTTYVQSLAKSGAIDLAVQYLLAALDADEVGPGILAGADVLQKLGHLEPSVTVLRKFCAKQPDNYMAQILLADAVRDLAMRNPSGWERDRVNEALRAYRMAYHKNPKNLQIVNNIAWLEWAAQGLHREAFQTAEPLRTASDLPPEMLETVGATYLGVGEFDKARIALEKALSRGGERATTLSLLAWAYTGLGRTNDANNALKRALKSPKPTPRDADLVNSLRSRIERGIR